MYLPHEIIFAGDGRFAATCRTDMNTTYLWALVPVLDSFINNYIKNINNLWGYYRIQLYRYHGLPENQRNDKLGQILSGRPI